MRGVWRAWIAALCLGLAPAGAILWLGRPFDLGAGIVLTGMLAAIPGLAALKPTLEAEQFIGGMRRSCGRVHIVEDELGWMFRRRLLIETPVGPWRIEGALNPLRHGIVVRPPQVNGSYTVRESPDEAGRVLMARVITAQPAMEEDREGASPRQGARSRRARA